MLIVVKCKDVKAAIPQMAVHVAEQSGLIPVLKNNEIVFTSIDDEEIDINKVIEPLRDFLKSLNQEANFAVTAVNQTISVTSLNGAALKLEAKNNSEDLFVCQHCGKMSTFESEHKNHEKIHYIGGA